MKLPLMPFINVHLLLLLLLLLHVLLLFLPVLLLRPPLRTATISTMEIKLSIAILLAPGFQETN